MTSNASSAPAHDARVHVHLRCGTGLPDRHVGQPAGGTRLLARRVLLRPRGRGVPRPGPLHRPLPAGHRLDHVLQRGRLGRPRRCRPGGRRPDAATGPPDPHRAHRHLDRRHRHPLAVPGLDRPVRPPLRPGQARRRGSQLRRRPRRVRQPTGTAGPVPRRQRSGPRPHPPGARRRRVVRPEAQGVRVGHDGAGHRAGCAGRRPDGRRR